MSEEEGSNPIANRIDQKLAGLSKTCNKLLIFRVHERLRNQNKEAYEPEMLSIGPYHHGKKNLQNMEKYKLLYLQGILERRSEASSKRYIATLMEVEEEARNYYAEHISLSRDDFVEMMLLDGCFIIEFLRKYDMDEEKRIDDPIFSMELLPGIVCRDLLLFENQLPFFILVKLFDMTKIPDQQEDLIRLAISCLNHCIGDGRDDNYHPNSDTIDQLKKVFHLLSLMYDWWCPSFRYVMETAEEEEKEEEERPCSSLDQNRCDFSVITFFQKSKEVSSKQKQDLQEDIQFIKSVRELKEHGIKFRNTEGRWLDIKFEKGVMEIPTLKVHDSTESLLRNLIVYELYMIDPRYSWKVVTDYTTFMDCLINSSKDVEMLRHEKIIENWLGSDEELSSMFNKLGNNVTLFPPMFSYSEIFEQVNEHCSKRCPRWIAELKKKYFNNPWSIFAFLGASLLLLLTLIQTIFSVLQYVKETKVVCNCK